MQEFKEIHGQQNISNFMPMNFSTYSQISIQLSIHMMKLWVNVLLMITRTSMFSNQLTHHLM